MTASLDRSGSLDNAAVELALSPIQPASGQLVAGLERPDVLLAVARCLRVQGPDNLCAVAPIAGPVRYAGFGAAEAVRRPLRIVAFVPGVADQDQLATDVAGRKFGGTTAAVVKCFPSGTGKSAVRVRTKGHSDFPRDNSGQRRFFAGALVTALPGLAFVIS
jgi:hypothetical protein